MTRQRFLSYALLAILLAVLVPAAVLIASDLVVHQTKSAVNIWGYRGPTMGRKAPNERRLAVLGESTAFGYGVRWNEAFPAYLEAGLNEHRPADRPITVANLAYNNEGAYSYTFTLKDYAYLDYDAVLFYAGYNDLGGPNTSVFRHESPIFRMTGYLPLLPYLFREKAAAIRDGWQTRAAETKTKFDPSLPERATAATLSEAYRISKSLEAQLSAAQPRAVPSATARIGMECGARWSHYCGGMYLAVTAALGAGKSVIVTVQPYYNWEHEEQQARMVPFIRGRFAGDSRVRIADLGRLVNLRDPAFCYDGLHLTPAGNQVIANALLPYVQDLFQ